MRPVNRDEYLEFLASRDSVSIGGTQVKLYRDWMINRYEPANFAPEEWTVWSFPNRGDWATHSGGYRGNWSPFIPRNLIHRFTAPGDLVCDPMVGSGTTLVECRLMSRRGVGVDINPDALMVAMNRLDFKPSNSQREARQDEIKLFHGDARNLNEVGDESVDLVTVHPPYCDIISYSSVLGDLSQLALEDFIHEIRRVADECFRVLKPNKHCGILIGDSRKHRHYVPINVGVLGEFLEAGFVMKEDIIKLQHNTLGSREHWAGHSYDFYKLAHEHLFVFRKPSKDEDVLEVRYSKKWW
jgi:DNA modification methylase